MEIDKSNIFGKVEKIFRDHISKFPNYEQHAIICCDEEFEIELIKLADRIKLIPPYDDLSHKDLYLTLIFIYYALLGEQTTDLFRTNFLTRYATDKELVNHLFLELTTGHLIEPSSGRDISQDIRRGFFGFTPIGGKNKTTNKRKKRRKTHKKRRKTRKLVRKHLYKKLK